MANDENPFGISLEPGTASCRKLDCAFLFLSKSLFVPGRRDGARFHGCRAGGFSYRSPGSRRSWRHAVAQYPCAIVRGTGAVFCKPHSLSNPRLINLRQGNYCGLLEGTTVSTMKLAKVKAAGKRRSKKSLWAGGPCPKTAFRSLAQPGIVPISQWPQRTAV